MTRWQKAAAACTAGVGVGVLTLPLVLLPSPVGTSEAAPAHAEVGDIAVAHTDGGVELRIVATSSSGMIGCSRLRVASAQRDGSQFTVHIQRGPFASLCNGDAIPRVLRVRIPTDDLTDAESIVVYQGDVELGGVYYPSLSPKCVWSRVGDLLRCE